MIDLQMPDGSTLQFPEDTDESVYEGAAQKYIAELSQSGFSDAKQPQDRFSPEYDPSGSVGEQAIENFSGSAKQFGRDIAQVVTNPKETAIGLWKLGSGAIQLLTPDEQPNEKVAIAVGQFFSDRYGSIDKAMKTLATDPVGMLGDLSMVITGGAGAVKGITTAGSMANKAAALTGRAGSSIDPINASLKAASLPLKAASSIGKTVIGSATGVSRVPLEAAFAAGRNAENSLVQAMRGKVDPNQAATMAVNALEELKGARRQEYLTEMSTIYKSSQTGDIGPIIKAVESVIAANSRIVNGVSKPKTKSMGVTIREMEEILSDWKSDPKLHTLENLDELKQTLDALWTPDASGRMVSTVRNATKREIVKQFPKYEDIMKDYSATSRVLRDLTSELSLGRNVNPMTTLRKLQAATRDNASASWGNRRDMIKQLDPDIMPMLSGQALNNLAPRGISGSIVGLGALANPSFLATLPLTSPRLMGEAALKAGQIARMGDKVAPIVKAAATGARIGRSTLDPMQGLLK